MTKKIKFLRRSTGNYSKLGRKRKKLQKWRKPKGRDNKMRLKQKSYPRTVEIGYKKDKRIRGKVDGKEVAVVKNIKDIENVKGKIIILGKIGKKKKLEVAKYVKEKGIKIRNLDVEKFLKENEKKEGVKEEGK